MLLNNNIALFFARVNGLRGWPAWGVAASFFVFLALGRAWTHLVMQPYLYMEQASVYYKYAFEHGWPEALLAPHQGYYNVWINFVTAVAAKIMPMVWAPYVVTFGGMVVGAVLAAMVFASGSPIRGFVFQLLALVVMVFVPPAEDRFTLTYGHFYMAAAVALVVVSEAKTRAAVLWHRRVLVFSVLCGPVSLFLLPVFVVAYFAKRARETLVQMGILCAGVVMQLVWLSYSLHNGVESLVRAEGGARFKGFGELDALVLWLYDRLLVYPFSSWQMFHDVGEFFIGGRMHALAVAVACVGLIGWAVVAWGQCRVGLLLVMSIACISVGNFFCSVVAGESKMGLITGHHRYFLAQAMLVGFVFVYQFSRARGRGRALYGVLVGVMLVAGVRIWLGWSAVAPAPIVWAEEVAQWKHHSGYTLRIMPPPYTVMLNPRP